MYASITGNQEYTGYYMTVKKLSIASPDEVEAVYYEAFMHCDLDVMAALWADEEAVCIHPGTGVISGFDAVMRSWSHIFTGARPPHIDYRVLQRYVSDELVVHLVSETINTQGTETAVVLATNVYQRFDAGWLMIEHHASLLQTRREGQSLQ